MIAMGCVGCGAPLEIAPDMEAFACNYCGARQRVERKGGTVALRKVEQAIHAVQRGTDKTAAELCLVRLEKEHAALSKELESAEGTRFWKILIVAGGALWLFSLGAHWWFDCVVFGVAAYWIASMVRDTDIQRLRQEVQRVQDEATVQRKALGSST